MVPSPPDTQHRLRMAPASPPQPRSHALYPVPADIEPWTEEAWAKHAAALEKRQRPQLNPWVRAVIVLLLISPSIVALAAVSWSKHWKPGDDLYGIFIVLFLFAIAIAAVAAYAFEGSGGYLDEAWDPGDGVNVLLLVLGVLSVVLGVLGGGYSNRRWSSGGFGRPWTWTRLWIGAVSCVNFVVIFGCWLRTGIV